MLAIQAAPPPDLPRIVQADLVQAQLTILGGMKLRQQVAQLRGLQQSLLLSPLVACWAIWLPGHPIPQGSLPLVIGVPVATPPDLGLAEQRHVLQVDAEVLCPIPLEHDLRANPNHGLAKCVVFRISLAMTEGNIVDGDPLRTLAQELPTFNKLPDGVPHLVRTETDATLDRRCPGPGTHNEKRLDSQPAPSKFLLGSISSPRAHGFCLSLKHNYNTTGTEVVERLAGSARPYRPHRSACKAIGLWYWAGHGTQPTKDEGNRVRFRVIALVVLARNGARKKGASSAPTCTSPDALVVVIPADAENQGLAMRKRTSASEWIPSSEGVEKGDWCGGLG